MLDQTQDVLRRLHRLPDEDAQLIAHAARARACRNPVMLANGHLVRCGSRYPDVCPSCARLARGDWSAIMRSGVFDAEPTAYTFVFLTCTAPGFGAVHRVPRTEDPAWCPCGRFHASADVALAGTPVDYDTYDFYSAVRFNRDIGLLWDRTRRVFDRLLPGYEYVRVYEAQARLVWHAHAILRVPIDTPVDLSAVEDAVRRVTATDTIDGLVWQWGTQTKALGFTVAPDDLDTGSDDPLTSASIAAQTVHYVAKAIGYLGKSIDQRASSAGQRHSAAMLHAARGMACRKCQRSGINGARLKFCRAKAHRNYGMGRAHPVAASRPGRDKTGWSLTGLTRSQQRAVRAAYMAELADDPSRSRENYERRMTQAQAGHNYLMAAQARAAHRPTMLAGRPPPSLAGSDARRQADRQGPMSSGADPDGPDGSGHAAA